jgi:hypothetical protein
MAAAHAAEALAFDQAARLYALAIELKAARSSQEELRALQMNLGHALVNAGQGSAAVAAYRAAAERAEGVEAENLERLAMDQLLRSGHIDEGVAAARSQFALVGLRFPASRFGALVSLLFRRASVRLRGLRTRKRNSTKVDPLALRRLDMCWSATVGLSNVDAVLAAGFQARSLMLALRAGDQARIAQCLALEAVFASLRGPATGRRIAKVLEAAKNLSEEIQEPHALAMTAMATGASAFLRGHWNIAIGSLDRAESIFRSQCNGVSWELDSVLLFGLWARMCAGQLQDLPRRHESLIRDALQRGDVYAATNLRTGLANMLWLMADDPARARREDEEAMRNWSQRGFFIQHYHDLYAQAQIDLYNGDGWRAFQRIKDAWPLLGRSMLLQCEWPRVTMFYLRARAALMAAWEESEKSGPLIRLAELDAARMEKHRVPWVSPLVALVRGSAFIARHQSYEAQTQLALAIRGFEETSMIGWKRACERRLGELLGGTEGKRLIRSADEWMLQNNIKNPDPFTGMLVPGPAAGVGSR